MWIERIEITGFGSLSDCRIEFSKDRLNLILEANEYGKSTIAEAIWAVLYDYQPGARTTDNKLKDREARRPASGAPYKACLDLTVRGRALRVVRDFNEKTVRVFDRVKGDIEVTDEFLTGATDDEVGVRLIGMGRELFRKTCFIGQRELDDHALGSNRDLAALLQSIADSSTANATSATAIGVLEDALSQFRYRGKKYKVDRLVKDLEEQRADLGARLLKLEDERLAVRVELKRLSELDIQIETQEKQAQSAEYFHCCLEAGEYDTRLIKAQERLIRVSDLKRQLGLMSRFAEFPIERQKKVEELWTTRQARLSDAERLKSELATKDMQMATRDLELREKWEGLDSFTIDDAQQLSSTARTLQNVLAEFNEAREKRVNELRRVQEDGVDMTNLDGVRKALLNLDARDLDDAYAYNAMINSAREQIGGCERSVWRARMDLQQAEEKRTLQVASRKQLAVSLGLLTILAAGMVAGLIALMKLPLSDPMAMFGLVIFGCLLAIFLASGMLLLQAKGSFKKEIEQSREEEQRQSTAGQELHNKVMGLEIRLEDMARKAGVVNGAELVKHIQAYAAASARLKDLDLLDQVIGSREQHLVKLKGEIEEYLIRAGRKKSEIDPETALKLSEEITRLLEERRSLQSSASVIETKTSELDFLNGQIQDIDTELKEHFTQAKVEYEEDVEAGYKAFGEAAKSFRTWDSARTEMGRMEQDTTSDLPPEELPKIIERFKARRDAAWEQMQALVSANANIAELPTPSLDPQNPDFAREIGLVKQAIESLRRERDDLTVHVRAATRNYDEHYLTLLEEKEAVDHDLEAVKKARVALELARDNFRRLSEETHSHWSARLNDISREMLSSLGTDYESLHFDNDLALTARRSGMSEPLQPANIRSQLSVGTREQIHWLARMAVSRFLSNDVALPIVMDEPFSEADDKRFLSMMGFLAGTLLKQHQIILFSCHHARHRWLLEAVGDDLRDAIEIKQLEPLSSVKSEAAAQAPKT